MLVLTKTPFVSQASAGWLLRQAIAAALLVAMGLLLWALIAAIRAPQSPPVVSSRLLPPQIDGATHAANVAGAHLFGLPVTAAQAVPIAAGSDISLTGIMYSQSADESRAIVVIGGNTVIAAQGMHLPDGAVISAIAQDRILLDAGQGTFSVMLDMRQANANERMSTLAVAGVGPGGIPSPYAPMGMDPDNAADAQSMRAQPQGEHIVVHGEYLPLSAIRGNGASKKFTQMGAPAGPIPAGRPPNP